jgi:hypothetical protein
MASSFMVNLKIMGIEKLEIPHMCLAPKNPINLSREYLLLLIKIKKEGVGARIFKNKPAASSGIFSGLKFYFLSSKMAFICCKGLFCKDRDGSNPGGRPSGAPAAGWPAPATPTYKTRLD